MSNSNSSFNLRSILQREKLTGTNFMDWYRSLRIVLKQEKLEYVLETAVPKLEKGASNDDVVMHETHLDDSNDVTCLMLATMDSPLQRQFEKMDAYNIIIHLKTMFEKQARIERFDTNKAILDSKQKEGEPVGPYVLRMIALFDNMERLGFAYKEELAVDIVLRSLHQGFDPFNMNYYMHALDKSLTELHEMLQTAETSIKTVPKRDVLMVQKGQSFKKKPQKSTGYKGKGKQVIQAKPSIPKAGKKKTSASESQCFKGNGHWKRDCPKLKEDQKNGTVA